jgi:steroid delta-isomerase-like uncharacterized protein
MSEANKALARRFYAEMSAGNIGIIDELVADDMIEHDEFGGLEPNKEGVRQFFTATLAAFPDLEMVADDMIAEGDKVFIRATMNGTHQGEFLGIPGTGRKISVPMGDYVRIADGKVVEHWGVTDTGAMMEQLTGE